MSAVQLAPEHRVMTALLQLAGHRSIDRQTAHLHQLGIRGGHGPDDCIIATYIHARTGLRIHVTATRWRLHNQPRTWWTLPGPVACLVAAHDRDQTPGLAAT